MDCYAIISQHNIVELDHGRSECGCICLSFETKHIFQKVMLFTLLIKQIVINRLMLIVFMSL